MDEPKQQEDALRALNSAAAFFHRELKSRLQTRRVPFLSFQLDTSISEGAEVLALTGRGVPVTKLEPDARPDLPSLEVAGILIVDKPAGWTSSDVVAYVRGRSRVKRVGHAGTLDPAATGVLPSASARPRAWPSTSIDADKTYVADIELGVETDTYDAEGEVVARADASSRTPSAIEAPCADSRASSTRRRRCTARSSARACRCTSSRAPARTSTARPPRPRRRPATHQLRAAAAADRDRLRQGLLRPLPRPRPRCRRSASAAPLAASCAPASAASASTRPSTWRR